MTDPIKELVSKIICCIRAARLDLSDEKATQRDLAEMFTQERIFFAREVRLSRADIIDFMIQGIGIEVKLQGAVKTAVHRQLVRYAKHDNIKCLILVSNLSMGLPQQIEGKDVYFVSAAEGWL